MVACRAFGPGREHVVTGVVTLLILSIDRRARAEAIARGTSNDISLTFEVRFRTPETRG